MHPASTQGYKTSCILEKRAKDKNETKGKTKQKVKRRGTARGEVRVISDGGKGPKPAAWYRGHKPPVVNCRAEPDAHTGAAV